jgi:hypothetical protein
LRSLPARGDEGWKHGCRAGAAAADCEHPVLRAQRSMLGEHRFHFFLWLAGAALSLSLMGGADYIPFLKEYPGTFFWLFLILTIVLLLLGVGPALQDEAHLKARAQAKNGFVVGNGDMRLGLRCFRRRLFSAFWPADGLPLRCGETGGVGMDSKAGTRRHSIRSGEPGASSHGGGRRLFRATEQTLSAVLPGTCPG